MRGCSIKNFTIACWINSECMPFKRMVSVCLLSHHTNTTCMWVNIVNNLIFSPHWGLLNDIMNAMDMLRATETLNWLVGAVVYHWSKLVPFTFLIRLIIRFRSVGPRLYIIQSDVIKNNLHILPQYFSIKRISLSVAVAGICLTLSVLSQFYE
jgi:hypothetical protein